MDVIQQSSAFQSPIVRLEAKHRRTIGEQYADEIYKKHRLIRRIFSLLYAQDFVFYQLYEPITLTKC
jgi:hypothetical protein